MNVAGGMKTGGPWVKDTLLIEVVGVAVVRVGFLVTVPVQVTGGHAGELAAAPLVGEPVAEPQGVLGGNPGGVPAAVGMDAMYDLVWLRVSPHRRHLCQQTPHQHLWSLSLIHI